MVHEHANFVAVESARIRFHRELVSWTKGKPVEDVREAEVEFFGGQVRRRAAPKEERVNRLRLAEPLKFATEGVQVDEAAVIPPDGDGEIAVAAMMSTER